MDEGFPSSLSPQVTPVRSASCARARRRTFWVLSAASFLTLTWLASARLAERGDAYWVSSLVLLSLGALTLLVALLAQLRSLRRELSEELAQHDHAQRQLRLHEAQSQALLNALPDLIFRIDAEGNVTNLSGRARQKAMPVECALDELVPGGVAQLLLSLAAEVRRTGKLGRAEYQAPEGDTLVDFEARAARCDERQVVVMVRAVAQRKRLERDLIAARETALEAARLKTKFLANMSHEIRTPMNGVIGMTNLLLETSLSDEQREYAQIIQKSGQMLLAVIDDILDFAKIEAGKLHLEDVDFDLFACVDDSIEAVASAAEARGLELGAIFAEGVTSRVRGDPTRLRQVLANLLSNAVRHTEQGHVVVRVNRAEEEGDGDLLEFAVEDSGQGIAESARDSLFHPVLLGDGGPLPCGGTGLGLAIARELVQLMGGEIEFRPAATRGSVFTFTARLLPRDSGRAALPRPRSRGAPRSALVAVPRADVPWLVEQQLAALGVKTERVPLEHARAAVAARASTDPYLVVIVDARGDSHAVSEVLDGLRHDPLARDTPVVAVARGTSENSVRLRKEATRVLSWPVRRAELSACLSALLGRTQGREGVERTTTLLAAHVLVADDDPINQRVMRRALASLGCTCEVVSDGAKAVERALLGHFDVILMDCQMPVVDGFEASARIRAEEPSDRHNRLVAITASSEDEDRRRSRDAQMDAFLTKPVTVEQLRETFARLLMPRDLAASRLAMELLAQGPRNLDAMRAALDVGDYQAVAKAAESFAAASARAGANRLSSASGDLAGLARAGHLSSTERGLETVSAELDGLRRSLAAAPSGA